MGFRNLILNSLYYIYGTKVVTCNMAEFRPTQDMKFFSKKFNLKGFYKKLKLSIRYHTLLFRSNKDHRLTSCKLFFVRHSGWINQLFVNTLCSLYRYFKPPT